MDEIFFTIDQYFNQENERIYAESPEVEYNVV